MIKWFKRNQEETAPVSKASEEISLPIEEQEQADSQTAIPSAKEGFFARFKKGLSKTRQQFGDSVGRLLLGKKKSTLLSLKTLKHSY